MTKELAYADIKVGDTASFTKTITEFDVETFAGLSGDFNPVHIDAEAAAKSFFHERVAHGILVSGLISAVIGTQLPGPNSIYMGQELRFVAPVKLGDTITATVEVTTKRDDKRIITLDTTATNQRGDKVITGRAVVKKVGL